MFLIKLVLLKEIGVHMCVFRAKSLIPPILTMLSEVLKSSFSNKNKPEKA